MWLISCYFNMFIMIMFFVTFQLIKLEQHCCTFPQMDEIEWNISQQNPIEHISSQTNEDWIIPSTRTPLLNLSMYKLNVVLFYSG